MSSRFASNAPVVSLGYLQTVAGAMGQQYRCQANLNIYDSPALNRLATQATAGRYLNITSISDNAAIAVRLSEDDYPGWLAVADLAQLKVAEPYQAKSYTAADICARIGCVIAFAEAAMAEPNHYLWGGTVGPDYDCSGLVQAAFAAAGIWLPRDAYQQEAFVQAIALTDLCPGDLVFFGTPVRATHVGIYLGGDRYIHSSGKDQGRNGIGIDSLLPGDDPVSGAYYVQLRGAGRVVAAYAGGN